MTLPNLRHDIRNVAIIAHVDHGKTTLVDALLKQSHTFRDNQDVGTLIMDTNDLEREKGITILAKNTSVRHGDVTINIIDTPGHADFGGEVERVLNMADGCLLLVDAAEGPMAQTRFVLRKAFEVGLRTIIVINKVDRANADPKKTLERVHDLFLELAEDADQLEAPVIYSIAKEGRAGHSPNALGPDLEPLFQAIIEHVPAPVVEQGGFQMLVANRAYDDYTGTMAIGRISRGSISAGDAVAVLSGAGEPRLGKRRGEMIEISYDKKGGVRLEYLIPTRGLIGFRNTFLTLTAGTGLMGSIGIGYRPWLGEFREQRNGALTASSPGTSLTYGLAAAQERGTTFIEAGEEVYEGMVVGIQKRPGDIRVNVCREKKQSNVRSSTSDISVRLTPASRLSLEQSLDFLADDELLDVTPKHLRLRKRHLTEVDQSRARRLAEV